MSYLISSRIIASTDDYGSSCGLSNLEDTMLALNLNFFLYG